MHKICKLASKFLAMSKNITRLGQVCVLRLRCLGQSNSPTQVGNSPGHIKTKVRRQPLPILRISLCPLWGVDLPPSHFSDILQGLVAEHFQISPQSLGFTGIIQIHWGMGNGSRGKCCLYTMIVQTPSPEGTFKNKNGLSVTNQLPQDSGCRQEAMRTTAKHHSNRSPKSYLMHFSTTLTNTL